LNQRNDQIKDLKNKIHTLEVQHRHVIKKLDEENVKTDEVTNELTVMTKARDRAVNSIKLLKNDKKLLEVEIENLRDKNETMKLQFVKAKYKKYGFDEESDFDSPDKSANKAAALELKLLRQSVNKLGQDVTIQRYTKLLPIRQKFSCFLLGGKSNKRLIGSKNPYSLKLYFVSTIQN